MGGSSTCPFCEEGGGAVFSCLVFFGFSPVVSWVSFVASFASPFTRIPHIAKPTINKTGSEYLPIIAWVWRGRLSIILWAVGSIMPRSIGFNPASGFFAHVIAPVSKIEIRIAASISACPGSGSLFAFLVGRRVEGPMEVTGGTPSGGSLDGS